MFDLLTATDSDQRRAALEQFLEFWYGPHRPEFGEPDVAANLPAPLRRFYACAGRWPMPDPWGDVEFFYQGEGGHHLLPPEQITTTAGDRLRFFVEYQGGWSGLTLPGEIDPPVWIEGRWDEPTPGSGTRQVATSLARFLVTHCLMTTVYEPGNSPRPRSSSNEIDKALKTWFQSSSQDRELLWVAEPDGCPQYAGSFHLLHRHVLVHESATGHLKFGALHSEGVELLQGVIGADA